jgi:hypothetical protein
MKSLGRNDGEELHHWRRVNKLYRKRTELKLLSWDAPV